MSKVLPKKMSCCCVKTREHCLDCCHACTSCCFQRHSEDCTYSLICFFCCAESLAHCYSCCASIPSDCNTCFHGTLECSHFYLCLSPSQRKGIKINGAIEEWMGLNCVSNGQMQSNESIDYYAIKNVAILNPRNIFILPSPYDHFNNYLFSCFTRFWDVLDDDFVEKGGLGPHNLINDGLSDYLERPKGQRTVGLTSGLNEKQSLIVKLAISRELENGEGTIRHAIIHSFLGSLLPLEVINLILFYESIIEWYAKGGYSSALCGIGAPRVEVDEVRFLWFFSFVACEHFFLICLGLSMGCKKP